MHTLDLNVHGRGSYNRLQVTAGYFFKSSLHGFALVINPHTANDANEPYGNSFRSGHCSLFTKQTRRENYLYGFDLVIMHYSHSKRYARIICINSVVLLSCGTVLCAKTQSAVQIESVHWCAHQHRTDAEIICVTHVILRCHGPFTLVICTYNSMCVLHF